MATAHHADWAEVEILGRILGDEKTLSPTVAEHLLAMDFSQSDRTRMHDLAIRNQAGKLAEKEREELLGYTKAGCLLGVIHARARKVLRTRTSRPR